MRKNKNKKVTIRLSDAEHTQLKEFAYKEGQTISDLFRNTILKSIPHESKAQEN